MKRLLDVDPWTGVREYFEYDHNTGDVTITRVQDVEQIIDRAKAIANDGSHWKHHDKQDVDMRLMAIVPAIVQEKWLRDHGVNVFAGNKDYEQRRAALNLLNSSDWKWLKTAPGKV